MVLKSMEFFGFLSQQLSDLKKAKEDLYHVTKQIHRESTQLFEKIFLEINLHLTSLFRRLFGGGRAKLRLANAQDVLQCGIDIVCRSHGKKLESINLLSGGEKSMTAEAPLFATFMVKPLPFCLFDEINAALDESNVGRSLAIVSSSLLRTTKRRYWDRKR